MADTYELTIESSSDHESETIEVPVAAIEALSEDGGRGPTEMAGDLVMLGVAQQMHGRVFHSDEAPQETVKEANDALEELFKERFGQTFLEMAGHDH